MKNLFKWILSKDEKEQKPVWTPYEVNERKYEERHKREQLLMK
ncbi:ORF7 [Streptococcus phage 01205]|uniref:ORF7 n=1 Tax=Streptococcus phage O1205 TaxID=85154 RepID=O34038_BPO12|nr:ORF7 [Streptococcus phage 01205]AAC79523.1 ORF7 [Streptococcus phage 01205]